MSDVANQAVSFLRAVERRDLSVAAEMLAPKTIFIYPRGATYHSLQECVADRSTRYRSIRKEIEGTHVAELGDGLRAVYVFGTLEGEALDGSPIRGVRFIDRLTFADDLIVRHDVWNDLVL